MKRIIKITWMLLSVMVVTSIISCDEDAITYSGSDVSDRISSLSSTAPGQGSILKIDGSQMDEVLRLFVGNINVTSRDFISQDESSIRFVVPPSSALGENKLLVVWPGFATGTKMVNVVQFHTVNKIAPAAAASGQMVRLFGNNLNLVETVSVNGTAASIVSKSSGVLIFTMPAGATTGPVTLNSSAGEYTTSGNLIACESEPGNVGCLPVINTNGSFEDGDAGVDVSVPGWGGIVGGNVTAEVITGDAYEGNKAVKMTINTVGANPWNIQPNSSFPVDPTATYRLSLWVKGTGIATIKFPVDGGGSPNYNEVGGSATMSLSTNEWTEISYEFQPTDEASGDQISRFAISISYPGNVGGVFYMDNLRVVKVSN